MAYDWKFGQKEITTRTKVTFSWERKRVHSGRISEPGHKEKLFFQYSVNEVCVVRLGPYVININNLELIILINSNYVVSSCLIFWINRCHSLIALYEYTLVLELYFHQRIYVRENPCHRYPLVVFVMLLKWNSNQGPQFLNNNVFSLFVLFTHDFYVSFILYSFLKSFLSFCMRAYFTTFDSTW